MTTPEPMRCIPRVSAVRAPSAAVTLMPTTAALALLRAFMRAWTLEGCGGVAAREGVNVPRTSANDRASDSGRVTNRQGLDARMMSSRNCGDGAYKECA